ncbi:MAG: hypothetical protein KTR16_17140 [Acidiferrobacterales bacterium]|nr:hypothetical protein [Acidiferrobacterales bacterium]
MILPSYATLLIIATIGFLAAALSSVLTLGIAAADLAADKKRRFTIYFGYYIVVWFSLALWISYTNILVPSIERAFPLLGVSIIGPALLGSILLFRSPAAIAVLNAIPVERLITLQIYRIIGVVFLLLQSDGLLSAFFAFSTGWGDILVGLTAPIVGFLIWKDSQKYRYVGIGWCITGMSDLFLVLYKAISSAPGPLQTTSFDLPTEIIAYFPFTIIPLLVVPISLILHVAVLRRLLYREPDPM